MAESHSGVGATSTDTDSSDKEFSCPTCGNSYDTEHGLKTHRGQYCDGVTGVQYTCDWCGAKDTKRPSQYDESGGNFCSRGCMAEWFSKDKMNKIEYDCDYCGGAFELHPFRLDQANKHFCPDSDCYGNWQSENNVGENARAYNGGYDGYYGPNWLKQRREAWRRDQYRCQVCGKAENELGKKPSVHHIKRMEWFKENFDEPEWYEKGNKLSNLISLCESHHGRVEGWNLSPDVR